MISQRSPWRNRLARSAVNRKVGGSSPPGDVFCLKVETAFARLNEINLFVLSFALKDDKVIVRNIFTVHKVHRQVGEG